MSVSASYSDDASGMVVPSPYIEGASNQDIFRLAGLTFDLIHKHAVAPTPIAYAVLFNYCTGSNTRIVKAIDGLLKTGRSINQLEIVRLHEAFIENRFVADAQMNIGLELQASVSNVSDLIEGSLLQSESFQQTLTHTQDKLCDSRSPDALRQITENLLTENSQMIQTGKDLGQALQQSQKHITALSQRIEELEAVTLQDPLTGIYNRRAFDARLRDEIEAACPARTFCLAIVDIDHFKRINDMLGHQMGDTVLVATAELLTQFAETEGAIVARYGGEEFTILMPNVDIFTAHNKLVELKKQINTIKCLTRDDQDRIGSLSASFGQSKYVPGRTASELFEIADQKLYEAKRSGRNAIRSEGLNT
jgi:diguanylate cyclase